MQAAVHEVGGHIHQARPRDGIGANQRDVVLAQQCDEAPIAEALMAYLDGVAQRPACVGPGPGAPLQPLIMTPRQRRRRDGVVRQ
ncbi:MAG: hypothetical protein ACREF1_06445, partial [Acetobacteraceae bacterium]